MPFIHIALVVSNIAALKALNNSSDLKRIDGVFLAVGDRGDGLPGWYRYDAASTNTESLPDIVSPADNVGRWFQFGGATPAVPAAIAGSVICTTGAPVSGSGKAFEFASYGDFSLTIAVDSAVSLLSGSTTIIVHLWTQVPNSAQTGKIEPRVISLPNTGGSVIVSVTSGKRWLTLGAKFASQSFYDCPYFTAGANNNLTIVGR